MTKHLDKLMYAYMVILFASLLWNFIQFEVNKTLRVNYETTSFVNDKLLDQKLSCDKLTTDIREINVLLSTNLNTCNTKLKTYAPNPDTNIDSTEARSNKN